jgi:hypothetical protein
MSAPWRSSVRCWISRPYPIIANLAFRWRSIRATLADPRDDKGTRDSREETNMPSTINLYQIGVWFCVGFFTGAGWAVAAVLVGRLLSAV